MADNIKYRFIQNVGDYFPSGYFSDDFQDKVQKCAGIDNDEIKDICTPFVRLKQFLATRLTMRTRSTASSMTNLLR